MYPASASYKLSIKDGEIQCNWRTDRFYTKGETGGVYVYGPDYAELLGSLEAESGPSRIETIDPRSLKFRRLVATRLEVEQVYQVFRYDQNVENCLKNSDAVRELSINSPETYLTHLVARFPELRNIRPLVRESIESVRGALIRYDRRITATSIDALEGTPFLLALINVVNNAKSGKWAIFGPKRYSSAFNLSPIERPFIESLEVLARYEVDTHSSQANAAERFEKWSKLRLGFANPKALTLKQANEFISYTQSLEPDKELISQLVPPQIPAPLNVKISAGAISRIQADADATPLPEVIQSSCAHLLNIIEDIESTGNLSNWYPGALKKLDRVKLHITAINAPETRTISAVIQLGLDGQSLRDLFSKTKDELRDETTHEFSNLFLNLDLVLAQFPAWNEFLINAEGINWGRHASQTYVDALNQVYRAISEAPNDVVSEEISAFAEEQILGGSQTAEALVGSTASARNMLSVTTRHLLEIRDQIIKSGKSAISDQIVELSKSALHHLFSNLGDVLLTLAHENPRFFGWIETAGRLIGWIK